MSFIFDTVAKIWVTGCCLKPAARENWGRLKRNNLIFSSEHWKQNVCSLSQKKHYIHFFCTVAHFFVGIKTHTHKWLLCKSGILNCSTRVRQHKLEKVWPQDGNRWLPEQCFTDAGLAASPPPPPHHFLTHNHTTEVTNQENLRRWRWEIQRSRFNRLSSLLGKL